MGVLVYTSKITEIFVCLGYTIWIIVQFFLTILQGLTPYEVKMCKIKCLYHNRCFQQKRCVTRFLISFFQRILFSSTFREYYNFSIKYELFVSERVSKYDSYKSFFQRIIFSSAYREYYNFSIKCKFRLGTCI